MTRYWPASLPTPIGPGFELTPSDPFLTTDMEVGPARKRSLTQAAHDRVQAVWVMTNAEFVAFRAWFMDAAWSLSGASDDLSAWTATGALWQASGVGTGGQLVGRLTETGAGGEHRLALDVPGLVGGATAQVTLVVRAAGRDLLRVGLIGRDGVQRAADIDLTSGLGVWSTGLSGLRVTPQASGWFRITLTAPVGSGASAVAVRVTLLSAPGVTSYAGTPGLGVDLGEVNTRVPTGFDLFVPTDAAGRALGAARGAAWALIPIWTGGLYAPRECRFEKMWTVQVLPGLNTRVTAPLEVRNA